MDYSRQVSGHASSGLPWVSLMLVNRAGECCPLRSPADMATTIRDEGASFIRPSELFAMEAESEQAFVRAVSSAFLEKHEVMGHLQHGQKGVARDYLLLPRVEPGGTTCRFLLCFIAERVEHETSFVSEAGISDIQLKWEIAERKKTEAALRAQSEVLLAITRFTPLLVLRVDEKGFVTQSQGAGLTKLNLGDNESVGERLENAFPGLKVLMVAALAGEAKFQPEVTLVSGSRSRFDTWVFPNVGRRRGAIGVCMDVTDRVNALAALKQEQDRLEERVDERTRKLRAEVMQRREIEHQLRDNQTRLNMLLNRSPAIMWTVDDNFCFTSSMGAGLSSLQLVPDEVKGKSLATVFKTEDSGDMILKRHREALAGKASSFEVASQARVFIAHVAPLIDEEGKAAGVIGVALDVTHIRNLERELLEIREREHQRIGQDLHDDLGQQLTGIGFMLKVLSQRIDKHAPQEARLTQEISQLVQQSISHTRALARGFSTIDLERGGLVPALEELSKSIGYVFGIKCRFQVLGRIPELPLEPATHLYRIAQEAVQNSVKHGGSSTVMLQLRKRRGEIVLSILDNGSGLPQDYRQKQGLGLRIMEYRATQIGASVRVASKEGGGVRVDCRLPMKSETTEAD